MMKKEPGLNDDTARDESRDQPNARNVQGKALQMNDNSAGGKMASPAPPIPASQTRTRVTVRLYKLTKTA
jgi:hypothetical protein